MLDGLRLQWFYADGDFSLSDQFRTYMNQLVERIAVEGAPGTTCVETKEASE